MATRIGAFDSRPRNRLGMVGGGEGAFIGAVHRIVSRIDDEYELVAGALSSTPQKTRRSGEALVMDQPQLAFDMLAAGSMRLRQLVDEIEQLKARSAPQRIADFFVHQAA